MTQNTIRILANEILVNNKKANSTGLYNGKAGLSLVFFITAKYLGDEQLEDTAYKLLQESLIIKNFDVSFENGLSGIGYALLYLIENKYLEADFNGTFGIQYEAIIKSFENIEKEPLKLVNSLQTVYFLSKASVFQKEDDRIQKIIQKIFEGLELFLTVQFHDFADIYYINKKIDVLNIYKTYLKLVDYSDYNYFSHSLLSDFADLYRKGRIVSSFETGFYLSKILKKHNEKKYEDVIYENIFNGTKNIHVCMLSLNERIDFAKTIPYSDVINIKVSDILPDIESLQNEKVIRNLMKTINEIYFPFGYGAGLGRLLIYCINKNTELL